jgi:DNA primase
MHEEKHRSFGVNKHTLLCKCYVCGRMSLYIVLMRVLDIRKIEALNIIRKNLDSDYSDEKVESYKKKLKKRKIDITPYKEEYEYFQFAYSNYMIKKGFTKKTMNEFEIYYNYEDKNIIFPVFEGGKFVGMMYRKPYDGSDYWYNDGFDKTVYVYNIDKVCKRKVITIVESPKDVAWMYQCGIYNAVSFFGTNFGKEQVNKIRKLSNNFVLGMDNDSEGDKANRLLFKYLKGKNRYRVDYGYAKDPGEMWEKDLTKTFAKTLRCFRY